MRKLFIHVSSAILLITLIASSAGNSHVMFGFGQGEKAVYSTGDTLEILVKVTLPPSICADGMEQTKLYRAGLDILSESPWRNTSTGKWEKQISIVFAETNRKESRLTVFRKADKGNITYQHKFSRE